MMKKVVALIVFLFLSAGAYAQKAGDFNGLNTNLGNLYKLSNAKTRSISPENITGEKGKGGMTPLEEGVHGHQQTNLK